MATRELEYRINVNADGGIQGVRSFTKAVQTELGKTDDAFTDTTTNAQKVARALGDMADKVETELAGASKAADALGAALGPELTARTDVDAVVADLRKMGLTFEEIEADADSLAGAIKKIDSAAGPGKLNQSLDTTKGHVKELGEESDQTKSVMANMVGNTAGELAELGGAGAVAGQAIGQLGEYATEGGISLQGLTSLAGPMAALGLATQAVSTYMSGVKLQKEFDAKRVEDFVAAFKELKTVSEAVNDSFETTGKLEFVKSGGFLGLGKTTKDATADLDALGLTLADFNELVDNGAGSFKGLVEEISGAPFNMVTTSREVVNVADAVLQMRGQVEQAEDATDRFNRVMGKTPESSAAAKDAADQFGVAVKDGAELAQAAADTIADAYTQAIADNEEALKNNRDANRDNADALQDLADQLADTATAYDELTARFSDEASYLSVLDSFDRVEDAGKEAFKASSEGAEDAERKARDYRQEILTNLIPSVEKYAREVLQLPEDQITEILTEIEKGSLADARRTIDKLTETDTKYIQVIMTGGGAAAGLGGIQGLAPPRSSSAGVAATRTTTPAPVATSTPLDPVATIAVPAGVTTVNVNVARGATGREIVDTVNRWVRVNGRP